MIIVQMTDGLGNQMFQYAMGRSVARARCVPLLFDLSFYASQQLRRYQLNVFGIRDSFATADDIAKVTGTCYRHLRRRLFNARRVYFRPYYKRPIFEEQRKFQYDPCVVEVCEDAYLMGFWQNWRYAAAVEDLIRRDFTFRRPLTASASRFALEIDEVCSVAVHVRRADYVSVAANRARFGACDATYYRKAAEIMRDCVGAPHFFVFSDDPEWAEVNLSFLHPMTIVSERDARPDYEDMRLMSMCKHFVIANSSFSWWAAWLGCNERKVVLLPREWLRGDSTTCADMSPPTWQRI